MKAFVNSIAMFAATAVVLGTSAFAQTFATQNLTTVTVPFPFEVAGGVLPAGQYSIRRQSTNGGLAMVTLKNETTHKNVVTVGSAPDLYQAGSPAMLFRCQAGSCSLSGLRNDNGSVSFTPVHKTSRHDTVAMIALPLRATLGN